MPESIARLKRENSNLQDQLSAMADEIAKIKRCYWSNQRNLQQ